MRKLIAKYLAFPGYDLLKHTNVRKFFQDYSKMVKWSRDQISEYQFERFKKLFSYAFENISFYREKYIDKDITPDDIKKIDDLKRIPALTRQEIFKLYKEIKISGKELGKVHSGSSSGSTGEPISYYIDTQSQSAGKAAMYLGWGFAGWRLGDKGLHIWGNPKVVKEQWNKPSSKIKDIFFNYYKYPAYKLIEKEEFGSIVAILNKYKFDFIDGYTTAIYLIAKYIEENGLKIKKLKYVLTTAETLQDFQRKVIERSLGPVFDGYGCSEIQGIANQCRICGQYHTIDPRVIVEFDNNQVYSDGSMPLIVTELDNYIMPFIKYRVGDIAKPAGNNNCDIKFNSISKITGRTSDIITLPSGGNIVVASFFGAALLKKLDGKIKQYQIIKKTENLLIIKISVNVNFDSRDMDILEDYLSQYLKNNILYKIEIVEKILISKNGKFKLLIDQTIKGLK